MRYSYTAAWTFRHPLRPQTRLRLIVERRRGETQHTVSLVRLGQLGKTCGTRLTRTQAPNFDAGMVPVGPGIMPVARVTFVENGRPAELDEEFLITAGDFASDQVAAVMLPAEVVHVAEYPGAAEVMERERAATKAWADSWPPLAAAG